MNKPMRATHLLAIVLIATFPDLCLGMARVSQLQFTIPATIIAESGVMVQAKVNGQGPYRFLIDSGAANSYLVDLGLAKKLGCKLQEPFQGTGAGEGSYAEYRCGQKRLQLGNLTIPDAEVVAIDMRPVCTVLGRRIDGVLGQDLFRKYAVAIDFLGAKVTISDPAQFRPPASGVELPLRSDRGLMLTEGSLSLSRGHPIPVTFLIDTGAIMADIFLNAPFAKAHGLQAGLGSPSSYHTIAGTTRFKMRRIAQLRLGSLVLEGPVANVSADRQGILAGGGDWDAVLGGGVLRRFRLAFDLPHSRVFLQPNSHFSQPFSADCSGLVLRADGPSLDRYVVDSVIPGSPAALAGIRENDQLRTVNGLPVAKLGLGEVRRTLRNQHATTRLSLERAAKRFSVTLRLHPML